MDEAEETYLPGGGSPANLQSARSADLARRREVRLPRALLAYDKSQNEIIGAFVMERCMRVVGQTELTFLAESFSALSRPFEVRGTCANTDLQRLPCCQRSSSKFGLQSLFWVVRLVATS